MSHDIYTTTRKDGSLRYNVTLGGVVHVLTKEQAMALMVELADAISIESIACNGRVAGFVRRTPGKERNR